MIILKKWKTGTLKLLGNGQIENLGQMKRGKLNKWKHGTCWKIEKWKLEKWNTVFFIKT